MTKPFGHPLIDALRIGEGIEWKLQHIPLAMGNVAE